MRAPKGNQNAKGHGAPYFNKNALKHGMYAKKHNFLIEKIWLLMALGDIDKDGNPVSDFAKEFYDAMEILTGTRDWRKW